jgi:murein DD-endopeptidase MepM/ murein hydrolase activator NlpD
LKYLRRPAVVPLLVIISSMSGLTQIAQAQQTDSLCPDPVLDRIMTHKVSDGESLDRIAKQFKLIPATIMGMNPTTRNGQVRVGQVLFLPPYNGIRVEVPAGRLIKDIARQYKVRADVLFELNGCQPAPRVVFIPGTNWSPNQGTPPTPIAATPKSSGNPASATTVPAIVLGYPLPKATTTLMGFGWKQQLEGQVALHSGLDLAAPVATTVLAAADGTVAFAANQAAYGNLVVLNHADGYQTRYAQLDKITVKKGQTVRRGDAIATVGTSGKPSSNDPHLHFEVRSNSAIGWVAADPAPLLR